jgi:hypothetical protein
MEAPMQPYDPSLQALAERVAMLEAQNRRLKQAGIAALVLASAVVLMGQTHTSRVLEANEFHLRDADGNVRARLSTDTANRPVLSLLDAKGDPVASLGGGRQPSLILFRQETNEQIRLGANTAFFGLGLYEKEIRAGLAIQNSVPGLNLFDKSGTAQATIMARPTGSSLFLRNPAGKEISTMWVDSAAGGSSLNMSGSAGSLSVNLGEDAGGPGLEIADNEGFSTVLGRRDVVGVGTSPRERKPAASVSLHDKGHKVLWSAP